MIYVTGDVHGYIDLDKLKEENWPEQSKLTKDDYLIIVGDFGAIWFGDERDDALLDWHNKKPYTTLFIDGNHENFDALYQYPVETWMGGKIRRIRDSIIHLERGQIFTINEKTIYTFGGASSIDRGSRTQFKDWWPQELPNKDEMDEGLRNLDEYDNKVDYILTHAAPHHIVHDKLKLPIDLNDTYFLKYLEYIQETTLFDAWYFGHYHDERDYDNLHMIYDQIIKLS